MTNYSPRPACLSHTLLLRLLAHALPRLALKIELEQFFRFDQSFEPHSAPVVHNDVVSIVSDGDNLKAS